MFVDWQTNTGIVVFDVYANTKNYPNHPEFSPQMSPSSNAGYELRRANVATIAKAIEASLTEVLRKH